MASSSNLTREGCPGYSFDLDDSRWLPYLHEHGYVVLKDILSPEDVDETKNLIWQDIEGAYSLSREDPSTWSKWKLPFHGIDASLAQTAGPWYVRGHPSVQRVFQTIWGTSSLITSMDAVILWRSDLQHDTEGLHLDQNPFTKPDLDCIQGMTPLLPVNEDIGGLEVVPFSHTPEAKSQFCEQNPDKARRGDFIIVDRSSSHCEGSLFLECNPGDLILWDSRTIHGGKVGPAAAGLREETPKLTRMSVTVAMTPREWASLEVQDRRRKGFNSGISFNHCPHEAGTSTGTFHAKRKRGYKKFQLTTSQLAVL